MFFMWINKKKPESLKYIILKISEKYLKGNTLNMKHYKSTTKSYIELTH